MSAAPGTEALDDEVDRAEPFDHGQGVTVLPQVRSVRPLRPPAPSVRVPQVRVAPSGAGAWARALRLTHLPVTLLGATVALLLVLAEPAVERPSAAVAVAGLVVLHLLTALLRALGDPDRGRAGPLRRAEAGRAVLVLAVVGALLAGGLTALRGWPALLVVPAGLAVVLLSVAGQTRRWSPAVAPLGTAAAVVVVWWAATGTLPWRVLGAAAAAGALVAAARATTSSRLLGAVPCVAVGLAVAVHALPWPALLAAATLPAARRAAVAGRPAAAPARLALLLVLGGLVVALATGADLPLTAAR